MNRLRKIGAIIIVLVVILTSYTGGAEARQNLPAGSESSEVKVTMDFKNADIKDVLLLISDKSGLNIIAGSEVEGSVTIKLQDVPWDKALKVVLKTQGYVYERDGNIIRVTTVENLAKEELQTKIFALNYAKAETLSVSMGELLTCRGKIQFDVRTNQLILTDITSSIKAIADIIEQLDSRTPQIQIEARIIETTIGEDKSLGIDWESKIIVDGARRPTTFPFSQWGPRGGLYPVPKYGADIEAGEISVTSDFAFTNDLVLHPNEPFEFSSLPLAPGALGEKEYFQFGTLDFTGLQATLAALFSKTDTNILSNPKITTLNNQLARITVGTKWPVATYSYSDSTGRWNVSGWEYIEYGILLDVTPTVNEDGYITLDVKPEVSDLTGVVTFEGAEVPIISTKQAEAQVMIKDGETLVIGGLIKDKVIETRKKIPFLGDIPLLGLLFSKKDTEVEKRDLLIFLTPHILKEAGTIDVIPTVRFEQERPS